METRIGLGQAGCSIAEKFQQYPQYTIYRLDSKKRTGTKFKLIPEQDSHEEYEQNCPSLKRFLKPASGPCLVIIGGSGTISGMCLRVLEQLKDNDLSVLYIKPDVSLLSELKEKQERVVFHVLQQYARSGLLKRLYIVDNTKLENVVGDVSVIDYYDKLNDLLVYTMHMINVFNNSKPVMSTLSNPTNVARISTIGIVDFEKGEENFFYDLEAPRDKFYFYALTEESLNKEGGLIKKIREQVKKNEATYGIYSTKYEQNYIYAQINSNLIQEEN